MARNAEEFAVETTESAGLPGRSMRGVMSGKSGVAGARGVDGDIRLGGAGRIEGGLKVVLSEVEETLFRVTSLRRRSSNPAPEAGPCSTLFRRLPNRGDPTPVDKSETRRCASPA
jgi:hypothetical protein